MQQFALETIADATPGGCSALLLDVTPLIVRRIRKEMRRRTVPGLSVSHYRTLRYLWDHPGASMSELADALGFTLPSASKVAQSLVQQRVVERRSGDDRRRVHLSLTDAGKLALSLARVETAQQLEKRLVSLTEQDLSTISAALRILRTAFSQRGLKGQLQTSSQEDQQNHRGVMDVDVR